LIDNCHTGNYTGKIGAAHKNVCIDGIAGSVADDAVYRKDVGNRFGPSAG